MNPTAKAVVMGSAQKPSQFDQVTLRADGIQLAERRTGGGAVYIDPASMIWVDLWIPSSMELSKLAPRRLFSLVGQWWQRALANTGLPIQMSPEPGAPNELSRLACWAGAGWGELWLGDFKVLGLSQRRTRMGARVQTMVALDDSPIEVVRYLRADDATKDLLHHAIGALPVDTVAPLAQIDPKAVTDLLVDEVASG